MNRYRLSRTRRFKDRSKFWFSSLADSLRAPFRRPEVLLITGRAPQAKVSALEGRLRFLISHLETEPEIRFTSRANFVDYIRSVGVATADSDVAPWLARRIRWFADLDCEKNPEDGFALIDLGNALCRADTRRITSASRNLFVDRVRKLTSEGSRPVYLFGTGPSLSRAVERSFDDGITVVCNTIVRDPELWHHLKPAFLVGGDPLYHFGDNEYARAFRADALRRLEESAGRTLFVYPQRCDLIVRREFREVESSLVPVPWGGHTDITVDLTDHFVLPNAGNVLNVLLLPVGCTLSKDVRLWGFDGRAPDDIGFWANSNRHSYTEYLQSIRDAHPAFFASMTPAGNEVKYVNDVHGDWLDSRLSEAEGRGFRFRMMHPSWTPTLGKRYQPHT